MARLPIVRHLRWAYYRWRVAQHYAAWSSLGYLPVNSHHDFAMLDRVWRGEA